MAELLQRIPARVRAVGFAVLAAVCAVGGWLLYHAQVTVAHGPAKDAHIVDLELGGWPAARAVPADHLRTAATADFWNIAGYGLALLIGALLARWLLRDRLRPLAHFALFAAAVTIVADCAENVLLLVASHTTRTFAGIHAYDAAAVAATIKFCAFVPAALVAITGVVLGLARGLTFSRDVEIAEQDVMRAAPLLDTDESRGTAGESRGTAGATEAAGAARTARWQRAYRVPSCEAHGAEDATVTTPTGDDVVGIGMSGGGVRAASTAFGVMQSEAFRSHVVTKASYLVSVSGGGYTSGAFAQFLTDEVAAPVPSGAVDRDAESAFLVGTPEEDYVRRHSSYLADTPRLMVNALAVIAWHLVLTLVLLLGSAMLVGVVIGRLYRAAPLAAYDPSVWTSLQHGNAPKFPTLRTGAYWALAIVVVLAALVWLAAHYAAAPRRRRTGRGRSWTWFLDAVTLARLAGVIAVLTVGLPALIWVSAWFLHHTRGGGLHTITPLAGVAFTYFASIGSLLWKNRAKLTKAGGTTPSALPSGFLQIVLVVGANLVLALSWLVLVGATATVSLHTMDTTSVVAVGVLAAAVVFLGGFTDETTLSLHPFYRARLAHTFAVRRVKLVTGAAVAVPYAPAERTKLSTYGRHSRPNFPHIVFAASATLGEHRAPPGQRRVSYTFCSHWVGGPDVGWVDTAALERIAPPRLERDLTVQGAVALSGAAIAASAGGQGSAWYESLFVLTGARLGAWMPNPAFVIDRYRAARTVAEPGLPRVRRLSYLLRELIGLHATDGPLLQVTDGGFYDNLGLIELLRRGCTKIYCIDASGDTPPTAATLAQTLTIAHRELGVQTELADDTWSTWTSGGGPALQPADPLAALSKRLSETGLIKGTFTYPQCGPAAGRTGELVVAKASLWPALGYPLLTYAHGAAAFPNDSTADQFFDSEKYLAYTELGRKLGDAVAAAIAAPATTGNGRSDPLAKLIDPRTRVRAKGERR